jgi:hypothetical protein
MPNEPVIVEAEIYVGLSLNGNTAVVQLVTAVRDSANCHTRSPVPLISV